MLGRSLVLVALVLLVGAGCGFTRPSGAQALRQAVGPNVCVAQPTCLLPRLAARPRG